MKTRLRPSELEEVLRKSIPAGKRRDISINAEGRFFDARNLAGALRRAALSDVIFLPPGEYQAFHLKKDVQIRSLAPGPAVMKGTTRISATFVRISGIEFRSEAGQPALIVEKGTVVLDECVIRGGLIAGSPTGKVKIFLKNCTAGYTPEGIVLDHQASAEILTSCIANCHVGLALRPGASGAVYHSRLEACIGAEEKDPGAGIVGDQAGIYCEGATFANNGVGIYAKSCDDVRIYASHFHHNESAAVVATDGIASAPLHMHSCVMEFQASPDCAQAAFTGGAACMDHSIIKSSPSPAISFDQARMEINSSKFFSQNGPAVDARSSHISAHEVTCASGQTAALAAAGCQGVFRNSSFTGHPPSLLDNSSQLLFENCEVQEEAQNLSFGEASPADESTDGIIEKLGKSVEQESVRNELERILRFAHACQQRKKEGLPLPEQSFHCVFMGPEGTGKLAAARALAEGLFAFGMIPNATVTELNPGLPMNGEHPPGGVLFVRARDGTASEAATESFHKLVSQQARNAGEVIILEGERDELRRLLRSQSGMDRIFRKTLFFSSYGPVELASYFACLCRKDRIPLSAGAKRDILILLHLYFERKDKRFANTHGVDLIYEAARRRFLERCSIAGRVDLEMETRDFDIPQDKAFRSALERSPAFVTFCPSCKTENPWLAGLGEEFTCLNCDTRYLASWGIGKDSSAYERLRESHTRVHEAEALPRRASLPAR